MAIGRPPTPLRVRFDEKWMPEPNSGCWLWLAAVRRRGYGIVSLEGPNFGNGVAHRVSWEIYRGPIPKGLSVLHRCDVPSCVNPDHLFLGTPLDNVTDMLAKGRAKPVRGEAHHTTHLTDEDVYAIRASDIPGHALATTYSVSQSTISHIRNCKSWRHI